MLMLMAPFSRGVSCGISYYNILVLRTEWQGWTRLDKNQSLDVVEARS